MLMGVFDGLPELLMQVELQEPVILHLLAFKKSKEPVKIDDLTRAHCRMKCLVSRPKTEISRPVLVPQVRERSVTNQPRFILLKKGLILPALEGAFLLRRKDPLQKVHFERH